jgi:hypothetical protein
MFAASPNPPQSCPTTVTRSWQRLAVLALLVAVAAASRLLPHPQNFTPLGAIALFAGACCADRRAAFAVPLAAIFLSDVVLGFHELVPVVYACLAFNTVLGIWVRSQQRRPAALAAATLLGAVVFFAASNFAVWVVWYPHTSVGLAECYVSALPFFVNSLLGDTFYTAGLFGALALVEAAVPAVRDRLAPAPAPTGV